MTLPLDVVIVVADQLVEMTVIWYVPGEEYVCVSEEPDVPSPQRTVRSAVADVNGIDAMALDDDTLVVSTV